MIEVILDFDELAIQENDESYEVEDQEGVAQKNKAGIFIKKKYTIVKTVNEELSMKWDKEMKKRNDYFASFDISTLTFTDENLKDIDACFEEIKKSLKIKNKTVFIRFKTLLFKINNC